LLNNIEPIAFLHDATTKNVIVSGGKVSGLVDVDEMAFGDPLWTTALTQMSLLSARRPVAYIDFLTETHADRDRWADRLGLYTTIFCLGFLAELGQKFNQMTAAPIDQAQKQHLETLMASLL